MRNKLRKYLAMIDDSKLVELHNGFATDNPDYNLPLVYDISTLTLDRALLAANNISLSSYYYISDNRLYGLYQAKQSLSPISIEHIAEWLLNDKQLLQQYNIDLDYINNFIA